MSQRVVTAFWILMAASGLFAQSGDVNHVALDDWPWTREARSFFGPFEDGACVMLSSVGYVGGKYGGRNWELQHVDSDLKLGRKKQILDGAAVDEDRFQGMVEWNGELLMVVEKRYNKGQRSTFRLHRYDPQSLAPVGRPANMVELPQRASYEESQIEITKSPNNVYLLFSTVVPNGKKADGSSALIILVKDDGTVQEAKRIVLPASVEEFEGTSFAVSDAGVIYTAGRRKRGGLTPGYGLLSCEPGDGKWRILDDALPNSGMHHAAIALHAGSDDISLVGISGIVEDEADFEEGDGLDSLDKIMVYRLDAADGRVLQHTAHTLTSLNLPNEIKLKNSGKIADESPFRLGASGAYVDMLEPLDNGDLLVGFNTSRILDDYLSMRIGKDGSISWTNLLNRSVFIRSTGKTINILTENILPYFDGQSLHLVFNDTPERANLDMDEPSAAFTFLDRDVSAFRRSVSVVDGSAKQDLMFTRDSYDKALMRTDAFYADPDRLLVFIAKLQGVALQQALVEFKN